MLESGRLCLIEEQNKLMQAITRPLIKHLMSVFGGPRTAWVVTDHV